MSNHNQYAHAFWVIWSQLNSSKHSCSPNLPIWAADACEPTIYTKLIIEYNIDGKHVKFRKPLKKHYILRLRSIRRIRRNGNSARFNEDISFFV